MSEIIDRKEFGKNKHSKGRRHGVSSGNTLRDPEALGYSHRDSWVHGGPTDIAVYVLEPGETRLKHTSGRLSGMNLNKKKNWELQEPRDDREVVHCHWATFAYRGSGERQMMTHRNLPEDHLLRRAELHDASEVAEDDDSDETSGSRKAKKRAESRKTNKESIGARLIPLEKQVVLVSSSGGDKKKYMTGVKYRTYWHDRQSGRERRKERQKNTSSSYLF